MPAPFRPFESSVLPYGGRQIKKEDTESNRGTGPQGENEDLVTAILELYENRPTKYRADAIPDYAEGAVQIRKEAQPSAAPTDGPVTRAIQPSSEDAENMSFRGKRTTSSIPKVHATAQKRPKACQVRLRRMGRPMG